MSIAVAYHGRSVLSRPAGGAQALRLAPNLNREAVAFDAALRHPIRFREAVSALHDVVINDLRYKPRDREAYESWRREQRRREMQVRATAFQQARQAALAANDSLSPEFEAEFNQKRSRYWRARTQFTQRLMTRDREMWRMLMPLDPVVTVAPDVAFFECFSADQSSYGCLTLDRDDALGASAQTQLGTTNVDYSWALYDHFQTLRSYRETRLKVDPEGFESTTAGGGERREEKIDLPDGWLRGFMQVQAAMTLPMRRVTLSRDAVYSLLAWLRRHKARTSPRAMRFELSPGRPPVIALEPWEERITSHAGPYEGRVTEPVRIWGVRRLLSLARVLPLAEAFDVYLLGTGLPSFWVARMGEMRLTLGLSGWTANDWSGGSSLDLLAPPGEAKQHRLESAASALQRERALSFDTLQAAMLCDPGDCAATLNQLALAGQVIHDLQAGVFRWRQVMDMPLGAAELGEASQEATESKLLLRAGEVELVSRTPSADGAEVLVGTHRRTELELVIDRDGVVRRGKCSCSHHHRGGVRRGPCRHLLALRSLAMTRYSSEDASTTQWYNRLVNWSDN